MPSRLRLPVRFLLALLVLGAFPFVPGCRSQRQPELQPTSLRLLWLDQSQFAGIYLAAKGGYFANEGLSVRVEPGGPDVSPVLLVASGSNDFGIAAGTDIIQARSNGVPVVAVATIFQKNPVVFFSSKEKNIVTPRDFPGRTVGIKYGLEIEYYYRIMLRNAGVDPAKVTEVPIKFDLARFFAGEVDVWSGYAINEPIVAEERGTPVNIIYCDDWGVPAVGDTIFTTEALIKNDPEKVRRFLRAVIRGWREALQNPDAAVAATIERNPSLDSRHERRMLNAAVALMRPREQPLGHIDPEKWRQMHQMMLDSGFLKQPIQIQTAYDSTFITDISARTN